MATDAVKISLSKETADLAHQQAARLGFTDVGHYIKALIAEEAQEDSERRAPFAAHSGGTGGADRRRLVESRNNNDARRLGEYAARPQDKAW